MLVAIERNKFTLIFKYDKATVSLNAVLDRDVSELVAQLESPNGVIRIANDLDRILPIFEQDHEVLLLEVDKRSIGFGLELIIYFHSIVGIYPLTEEAERLLNGKINQNIRVAKPLFASAVETTKAIRIMRNQEIAASHLLNIFGVREFQSSEFIAELGPVLENFAYQKANANDNFLYQLLSYKKTPGYVPSGNVEYLIKIGLITLLRIGISEDARNSKFVTKFSDYKSEINQGSLFAGFENFSRLLIDIDLKSSFEKICDNIGLNVPGLDLFEIAYFYIAIKSHLHKDDCNLLIIADELYQAARKKPITFAQVLLLVGHSFSFEKLYESIHALEQAPILKEIKVLGPAPKEESIESNREIDPVELKARNTKKEIIEVKVGKPLGRNPTGPGVSSHQKKVEDDNLNTTPGSENLKNNQLEGKYPDLKSNERLHPKTELELGLITQEKNNEPLIKEYSVNNFLSWLQSREYLSKARMDDWIMFIRYEFEIRGNPFNFESLKTILDNQPEKAVKLLAKPRKGKFDLAIIEAFLKP